MTTIGDIFDIPTQVHQGDFVLRLTAGVTRPADTLHTYVVTPQLVGCFDQALDLIRSALETATSKGAARQLWQRQESFYGRADAAVAA
jgi:hypothetical protein